MFCFPRRPTLALVLFVLALGTWGLYERAGKAVTVAVDGQEWQVTSFAATVGELLQQQGVALQPADTVEPGVDAALSDGLRVRVVRGFAVQLAVDGREVEVLTAPATVSSLLTRQGITLGPLDRVEPGPDTPLRPGTRVRVVRVAERTVQEEKSLPFREEQRPEPRLEKGINRVVQQGKPGLERITYRVTYEDGREVSGEVVKRETVRRPQNRVLAMGTISVASRGEHVFRFRRALVAESTAYTSTGRRTYTGVKPQVGTVAVDPDVIPLGARLYVEGYGYGVAQDIGSDIRGNRIDVYLETRQEALAWGRRRVKVYVLEE